MDLINVIGAQHSKDGEWLLVTFVRKDTNEKLRWLVPFNAKGGPEAFIYEGKTFAFIPINFKKEEPKKEVPDKIAEDELPF